MGKADNFLRFGDPEERREEIRRYIGPNAAKFLPLYDRMRAKGDSNVVWGGFCWPAFFVTPVWFFYRKLWWWAAGIIGLMIAVAFVPHLGSGAGLGLSTAAAVIGRRAYLAEAMKRLETLRESGRIHEPGAIEAAGGVSRLAGWISGTIFAIVYVLALAAIAVLVWELHAAA